MREERSANKAALSFSTQVKGKKAEKITGTAILFGLVVLFLVFGRHPIEGSSMEPTYHDGQTVYTIRAFIKPEQGDVVVAYSKSLSELLIKRVAAVSGDVVEITQDGEILINGEPYLYGVGSALSRRMDAMQETWDGGYRLEVPKGQYFLLGDNRENSNDSRELGTFGRLSIFEKVLAAR